MAFKILSDEELSWLNDNQRKQYRDEMNIYQERVAFVEQFEAHSKIDMRTYEPKFESIAVINKVETKPFTKPEYISVVCNSVVKPDLQINPFVMAEPIKPVLPVLSKRPKARIEYIKKFKHIKPKLPSIDKIVAPAKQFEKIKINHLDLPIVAKSKFAIKAYKMTERNQPSLPTVAKLAMQVPLPPNPVSINLSSIKSDMPKIEIPSVELHHFATLKKMEYRLPDVSVKFAAARTYHKPELRDAKLPVVVNGNLFKEVKPIKVNLPVLSKLPAVAKPNMNVKPFKKIKPIKTNLPVLSKLPAIAKPNMNVKPFKKIKSIKTNLPVLSDIATVKVAFNKPELQRAELSVVPKLSIGEYHFKKTKSFTPKLPKVSKLGIQIKDFDRPKQSALTLPVFNKMDTPAKTFKPLEPAKPNLAVFTPLNIAVKAFEKPERDAVLLPKRNIITIPDAYEKLKDLFQMVNGEFGELE